MDVFAPCRRKDSYYSQAKNFCSGTFKESPIPYLLYLKNNKSRNETVKQSNIYTIKYKNQFRTKVQIRKVGWE